MSVLQKIIAWILVFTTVISVLCVPAFAVAAPEPTDSRGDFYDWVVNNGGSFDGGRGDIVGGGRYSKDHYDDFLSGLPATGITSAGHLIWQVTFYDCDMSESSLRSYNAGYKCMFSGLPCASPAALNNSYVSYLSDKGVRSCTNRLKPF